ncbi:MAG: hypothetical protein ABI543_01095 [Ignavibacteria bacterium]
MRNITTILILVLFLALIAACDGPVDPGRSGGKMTGYITHTDSILYMSGGYYSVSIYDADSSNPFNRVPVRTDSLNLHRMDWRYQTTYSMDDIPAGRYCIASTWSSYPRVANEIPIVLGTYGCDTTRNCTDYGIVIYPNYEGHFRNIISWTDPTKRLN